MADARSRTIAIALWILWAFLLAWSFLRPSSGAVWFRIASSVVLVIAAWLFAASRKSERDRDGLPWIAIGMTFGCLGDAWALVPADRLPVHRLIPAMLLFGIGHLAYILGFLRARRSRPVASKKSLAIIAFWMFVVGLAWQWSINMSPAPPVLKWSALAYSALLGSTTAAATLLAFAERRFLAVAVGSMLFLFSDFVLATQSFRGSFPYATELCWASYGPGQMLIVFGMAWAMEATRSPESSADEAIRSGQEVLDVAHH